MNLALLNPFRQADRIDSTLTIPRALHPPRPKPTATAKGAKNTSTTDVATPNINENKEEKISDDKKVAEDKQQQQPPADVDIDSLILAKKSTEDKARKGKKLR